MTGIDYGNGMTNIDHATGIRYGIIHSNRLNPDAVSDIYDNGEDMAYVWWKEDRDNAMRNAISMLSDYLGRSGVDEINLDNLADHLGIEYPDCVESGPYEFDDGEYQLRLDTDGDIWVIKSPYVAMRGFCSPCAPGACHLESDGDNLCYCLGPDWFDNENPIPYQTTLASLLSN